MPIYRLLKGATFDPPIAEAASRAYENLLVDLQLVDRTDPFTEIVAQHVIAVGAQAFTIQRKSGSKC